MVLESDVEHDSRGDVEAEDDDLEDQTAHDDVGPHVGVRLAVPGTGPDAEAGPAGLDEEAEDVAEDEDAGEPVEADERELGAVDGPDDAAQRHVEGRGKEDRTQEEEDGLQDVGDQLASGVVRCRSANVAYYFDCMI